MTGADTNQQQQQPQLSQRRSLQRRQRHGLPLPTARTRSSFEGGASPWAQRGINKELILLDDASLAGAAWHEGMLVATILVASLLVLSGVFIAELPRLLYAPVPQDADADVSLGKFAVSRPEGASGLPVVQRKSGNPGEQKAFPMGSGRQWSPFKRPLRLARCSCLEEDASVPEKVPEEAPNSYTLEWTGITVWTNPWRACCCCGPRDRPRLLLRGVSGSIEPQRLAAVVGAPGSGKSALLRFLAGRRRETSAPENAIVSINGVAMDCDSLLARVAYMRLEDYQLVGTDSVRETLLFWATMRLPCQMPAQERSLLVDDLMEALGLDKSSASPVGTLSVAEQRRAAIGKELIGAPEALLLDDVFIGLDVLSALALAATLKELTNAGVPVLTAVEEPKSELFGAFEDVLILHRGQVCYAGPGDRMSDHFRHLQFFCQPVHCGPVDHVLFVLQDNELRSPGTVLAIQDDWVASTSYSTLIKTVETRRASVLATPGECYSFPRRWFWTQVPPLFSREIRNVARDFSPVALRLALTIICGLVLGLLFFGACSFSDDPNFSEKNCAEGNYDEGKCVSYATTRVGAGMVAVIWLCVDAVIPVLQSMPETRSMLREVTCGDYRASAGLVAKIGLQAVISLLAVVLFWTSVYLLMGWHGNFVSLVLMSWPLHCYMYALALTLACYIAESAATEALWAILIMTLPMAFCGGVLLPLSELAAGVKVQYLLPFKYAYQLIMMVEFRPVEDDIDDCQEVRSVTQCMGDIPGAYRQRDVLQDRNIYFDDWYVSLILFTFVTLVHLGLMCTMLRRIVYKRT